MHLAFDAEIIHWRGPAPYLFVAVPEIHAAELRHAARLASYGWGCVPVEARVGAIDFTTPLFRREATFLMPVKRAVRHAAQVGLGDRVAVEIRVCSPSAGTRPARRAGPA